LDLPAGIPGTDIPKRKPTFVREQLMESDHFVLATWPAAVQALKLEIYERLSQCVVGRGKTNVELKKIRIATTFGG
jgi:hypothetical protein